MKKRNNILFLLFVAVGMTGCNYMDELPYERSDAEDIFSSEALYERPTTQAYSYLKGGMSRVDDAFLEAATDNGTLWFTTLRYIRWHRDLRPPTHL